MGPLHPHGPQPPPLAGGGAFGCWSGCRAGEGFYCSALRPRGSATHILVIPNGRRRPACSTSCQSPTVIPNGRRLPVWATTRRRDLIAALRRSERSLVASKLTSLP